MVFRVKWISHWNSSLNQTLIRKRWDQNIFTTSKVLVEKLLDQTHWRARRFAKGAKLAEQALEFKTLQIWKSQKPLF